MLDVKYIVANPDTVKKGCADRGVEIGIDRICTLYQEWKAILPKMDELRHEQKQAGPQIARTKKEGGDASAWMERSIAIKAELKELERKNREQEVALHRPLLEVPNIPDADVPVGGEEANETLATHGEPATFDFEPRAHWDLGAELDLLELDRGARMTGSGFPLFVGRGARLARALINWFLDVHTGEHGYIEASPPFLVNRETMTGTGQLPKFEEDLYRLPTDDLFLIPTAEVPVTNIYREEILAFEQLPVRNTAYTPCFRREAGAAGKDTRGLLRLHQFDKVEMVQLVHPDKSEAALEELTGHAETLLDRLGLPYRRVLLATQDLGFSGAKTYDLEVHAAGVDRWLEVSSCTNFRDFQSRRIQLRFRDEDKKVRFVHTLNGSGLALPRIYVALLENNQQADGSVIVPEVLRPYMGGLARLIHP